MEIKKEINVMNFVDQATDAIDKIGRAMVVINSAILILSVIGCLLFGNPRIIVVGLVAMLLVIISVGAFMMLILHTVHDLIESGYRTISIDIDFIKH